MFADHRTRLKPLSALSPNLGWRDWKWQLQNRTGQVCVCVSVCDHQFLCIDDDSCLLCVLVEGLYNFATEK